MAVDLEHSFTTARSIDDSYAVILDLDRLIPCVEGGSVVERIGPEPSRARSRSRWARCP